MPTAAKGTTLSDESFDLFPPRLVEQINPVVLSAVNGHCTDSDDILHSLRQSFLLLLTPLPLVPPHDLVPV